MIQWETRRRQVAVTGMVKDAQTGKPMNGAQVAVTGPNVDISLQTTPDGHFHILDLPDGSYTIKASFPSGGTRYGARQAPANVLRTSSGKIIMASLDITLPSTGIKGEVTKQGGGKVVMAELKVAGSGERAFTDSDGKFHLTGIETGSRTILISAQGLKPDSRSLTISTAGDVATQNFVLEPLS